MFSSQEIERFSVRITGVGFRLEEKTPEGPNGEVRWTFSDDVADFQVGDDRGELFVAIGPRGGTCFVMAAWAKLLRIDPPQSQEFNPQLEYALMNLDGIRRAIESDDDILEKLLEVNWSIVKASLNLDPDMPRPGRNP